MDDLIIIAIILLTGGTGLTAGIVLGYMRTQVNRVQVISAKDAGLI